MTPFMLYGGIISPIIHLQESHGERYPWLMDDLVTSGTAKELLAKHLESYLHYLSLLPGVEKTVGKLKNMQHRVFDLLSSLRRPTDTLGAK